LGLCGGVFLPGVLDIHSVKAREVLANDLALGLLGELRVDVAVAEVLGDLELPERLESLGVEDGLWGAKNRITSLAADRVTTKQTYRSLDGEQMIVWVAAG
jgi:hypothetical protein